MPDLPYDKLTLIPLLIAAVVVLWRKLNEKDQTIAEALRILERSAEATEAVAQAMDRLRASLPQKLKSPEP